MNEYQAARQNSRGHPRPPWCTKDHSADGLGQAVHRGINVRVEVPGADGVPERIIVVPIHLGMADAGSEVNVYATSCGKELLPKLWLMPRDAENLAALADVLVTATRAARGVGAAIRKAAADITKTTGEERKVTGLATYNEASEVPWSDVLNRYQALDNRDAMARAIAILQARGEWNDDRARTLNPADYPPLTVDERLELIALGEVMARHYRHPAQVHYAVMAGATWEQIAAAGGGDPDQARRAYREWAEGQRRLRQDFPGGAIGLGGDEYSAAIEAAGPGKPAGVLGTGAKPQGLTQV